MKKKNIWAIMSICILLTGGCVVKNQEKTQESVPQQTESVQEESNGSAKEVTLSVWSGAEQKNITSSDTSVESERIFKELFAAFCYQKEDTEDIRVIGKEGFESIQDGVIQCGKDSISFLHDKFTLNQETFENAWYLELRTNDSHVENCVILPDGSKYIPVLKQLLENLQYHEQD